MNSFGQTECFISKTHSYAMMKFVYGIILWSSQRNDRDTSDQDVTISKPSAVSRWNYVIYKLHCFNRLKQRKRGYG